MKNETTKRQRNHAPAALLRLGALAQRLTLSREMSFYFRILFMRFSLTAGYRLRLQRIDASN